MHAAAFFSEVTVSVFCAVITSPMPTRRSAAHVCSVVRCIHTYIYTDTYAIPSLVQPLRGFSVRQASVRLVLASPSQSELRCQGHMLAHARPGSLSCLAPA